MNKNEQQILAGITASQWGLITTAQAEQAGVSRLKLSRLAEKGQFSRLSHGVYRDAGASASSNEDIKATWLSTNPSLLAEERIASPDIIIGGSTATYLWDCGDLDPFPYQFYAKERRQTQRREFTYIKRDFSPEDIKLIDGLPIARIEYAIADLIKQNMDLSLVSTVLKDARAWIGVNPQAIKGFDSDYFSKLLDPLAKKNGFSSGREFQKSLLDNIGEGEDEYKKQLKGLDEAFAAIQEQNWNKNFASVARVIQDSLPEMTPMQESMQKALDGIAQSLQFTLPKDTLETFSKSLLSQIEPIRPKQLSLPKEVYENLGRALSTQNDESERNNDD